MLYSSYIELSESAYLNNLNFLKQQIGPKVKFSSVIKGNAYGHGIEQFAPMAQRCGVTHFSVFSADEAYRLLQVLPHPSEIMIMGYLDKEEIQWAIENNIEFYVFENSRLEAAASAAKKADRRAKVHLELETGMNRLGYNSSELTGAVQLLQQSAAHVNVQGISTHYAGAECSENHERVQQQIHRFDTLVADLAAQSIQSEMLHTACSAAVMAYPETHQDLVRVGIMQYGFWSSNEILEHYKKDRELPDPLKRLITWKSKVMSLKHVANQEYIGYGLSYQAATDMVIATVPVGYSWGYSRSLSNQGYVLISGKKAPVVGIVNMNVLMVDVTTIPAVEVDDEVVLLGTQGAESISVASFSELSTQLNYEMLTRLPLNIPRVVVA